jgi:asparagine synthase (glutamine-hydrolysing)
MCGIAGIIHFNEQPVAESGIRSMMQIMKHRGPDDEGLLIEKNIGLGFVRLSILDLSAAGHQPMFSNDDRYVIIFNGEVYNYIEIKEKLNHKYSFKSNTDTEVVLNAFIEWGESCLNEFNGMFVFAILDRLSGTLFCARDRFGMKPFFYTNQNDSLIFCSELNPILAQFKNKPTADDEVIANYLILGRSHYSPDTFYKEIKRLAPGHFMKVTGQQIQIKQWYDIDKAYVGKYYSKPEEYLSDFKDAIQLQLRSDVPVGICLSGGLDSSAISSAVLKFSGHHDFHSYSAVYDSTGRENEIEYIKEFEHSGLQMHYVKPDAKDILKDIDAFIDAFQIPIPGISPYAELKVMELATNYSTVVLSGQGADEVLGGYEYCYGAYLKELLLKAKFLRFIRECRYLLSDGNLLSSMKYMMFFFLPSSLKTFAFSFKNKLVSESFAAKYKNAVHRLVDDFYSFSTLRQFSINHIKYKFEHHLMWSDRSGMLYSLEARFPFIDHRIIEKSIGTDSDLIMSKGYTKSIMRNALSGILPNKIRDRKQKVGFETPGGEWFRTADFEKMFRDILSSSSFKARKYFNHKKVEQLFEKHISGKVDAADSLWKVLNLELWLRKKVD